MQNQTQWKEAILFWRTFILLINAYAYSVFLQLVNIYTPYGKMCSSSAVEFDSDKTHFFLSRKCYLFNLISVTKCIQTTQQQLYFSPLSPSSETTTATKTKTTTNATETQTRPIFVCVTQLLWEQYTILEKLFPTVRKRLNSSVEWGVFPSTW